MINALNGRIVSVDQNSLIINVGGVEFFVEISTQAASYFSSLSKNEDQRVLTKYIVREDAALLYGFKDRWERDCFNQLQTVPGIGAKQALKILSAVSVTDFVKALDQRDVTTLSRIPGIGAKSAQKLILMLRDTLVITDDSPSGVESVDKTNRQWADVADSLAGMGFDRKIVYRTLDKVLKEEEDKIRTMDHHSAEAYIFPILLRRLS
ncbi:MAG: Holliday junction branch migration protein RuvA [Bullifex sp.]